MEERKKENKKKERRKKEKKNLTAMPGTVDNSVTKVVIPLDNSP
jgi:hypothetical protein